MPCGGITSSAALAEIHLRKGSHRCCGYSFIRQLYYICATKRKIASIQHILVSSSNEKAPLATMRTVTRENGRKNDVALQISYLQKHSPFPSASCSYTTACSDTQQGLCIKPSPIFCFSHCAFTALTEGFLSCLSVFEFVRFRRIAVLPSKVMRVAQPIGKLPGNLQTWTLCQPRTPAKMD